MIRVVAIITAKPGQREAFLAAFREAQPAVLQEKGCREYTATIDAEGSRTPLGPDTVAILETWDSMEDLAAHGAGAPLKAFGARTRELIEKRAVHFLTAA